VGALSVGLSCGWGYDETLKFANHTAALTVSAMGAMPSLPTLDRVEKFLMERVGSVPDTSALKA
jgi:ribokinase